MAIRSTIGHLVSSFDDFSLYIGKVRYMDFEEAQRENGRYERDITENDLVRYFFQKRSEFEDEREVRIVYREWLQAAEPNPLPVVYVPCDLDTLIQNVYVAPGSSKWFREDIATLLAQNGIDKPVEHSRLDRRP